MPLKYTSNDKDSLKNSVQELIEKYTKDDTNEIDEQSICSVSFVRSHPLNSNFVILSQITPYDDCPATLLPIADIETVLESLKQYIEEENTEFKWALSSTSLKADKLLSILVAYSLLKEQGYLSQDQANIVGDAFPRMYEGSYSNRVEMLIYRAVNPIGAAKEKEEEEKKKNHRSCLIM